MMILTMKARTHYRQARSLRENQLAEANAHRDLESRVVIIA
jgi:hypothetical protein